MLMAVCVMMISLSFINTATVQSSTKQVQGGRSMKSAKKISKSNTYVVKLNGKQSLWYKFKTPNYRTYLSCYAKNLSNTGSFCVYVYSKQEEELLEGWSLSKNAEHNEYCEYRLKSNTWYYIKVTNEDYWNIGKGNVKFSFKLNKDSIPDTMKQAKEVKIKKVIGVQ